MTQTARCTLYGETLWISPYVFSSFVALQEKGTPVEVVEVELAEGACLQPSYQRTSLTARVPAFEHQGFSLAESSAIAEYLDEVFAPPSYPRLLPENIEARARARQI